MKQNLHGLPATIALLACLMATPALSARSTNAAAPATYDDCIALVKIDAAAALDMAERLKRMRGEVEAGGMHCEALALVETGRTKDAGAAFFDLAEGMQRADDMARSAVYAQAGDAWAMAGSYDLAIMAFDNAIARTPDDATYQVGRARVKALSSDWGGTRIDATEALALDPHYPEALLLRAAANRMLGYASAALVDANRAIELRPHHLEALLERGLVHRALEDKASAVMDWTTLLQYARETGREDHPAAIAAKNYLSQ